MDATTWMKFHVVMTILWLVMMPVAIISGLWQSVAFISVISIYANFVGHFSAWQAVRAEENSPDA